MTETRLKVLAFDLEVAPLVCYTWGLWNQNIAPVQVKEWGRIICFSAQWQGQKKVIFKSEYHDGPEEMLEALWHLLDEADVVLGFNSDSYDLKWLEGEMALAGFQPFSPVLKIDLLKHLRNHSRFASKKLQVISQRFLGETKVPHSGMQLWIECIEEDVDPEVKRKAWNLMRRYAIRDTKLLFPLYEALKGWIKLPVPLVISDDGEDRCRCGSTDIQWRGWAYTTAYRYRRFQCNECGAWGRSAKSTANNGSTRQL